MASLIAFSTSGGFGRAAFLGLLRRASLWFASGVCFTSRATPVSPFCCVVEVIACAHACDKFRRGYMAPLF